MSRAVHRGPPTDGLVHAVFEGIMGTDELATALADVSSLTPSGGAPVTPTAAP